MWGTLTIRAACVLLSFSLGPVLAQPASPGPVPGAAPAPAGAPGLPTIEQLEQELAAGNHQDVMRQVAKLMALKGDAAAAYDRYDLFRLRGEAALRNKAMPMAADAFAQAAKATEDPLKQAAARANELLIRKSRQAGYIPRTAAPADPALDAGARPAAAQTRQPMPIIEPADRKTALAALLADEMAAAKPKIDAATKARNLPPVIEAIKVVGDLRAIETAAHGKGEQTRALAGELGGHAHELIAQALEPMKKRTEEYWQQGSRQQVRAPRGGIGREVQYGMMGLTSVEQNALKEIIVTCEKILPVASELAAVTENKDLAADAQEAKQLHARASEVLNFDYPNAGRYTKPPQQPGVR